MHTNMRAFFETIENEESFNKAQAAFLTKAALAFPELTEITIEDAVNALQSGIKAKADLLASTQVSLEALKDTQLCADRVLGPDPRHGCRNSRLTRVIILSCALLTLR